jgi:hypothetical protein
VLCVIVKHVHRLTRIVDGSDPRDLRSGDLVVFDYIGLCFTEDPKNVGVFVSYDRGRSAFVLFTPLSADVI